METRKIRLLVPTGKTNQKLLTLLQECGFGVDNSGRNYRPRCQDSDLEVKLLKPINIPTLVELGRHDFGFCGLDWVKEHRAKVDVLLELGLDPVKLVVASPVGLTLSKLRRKKKPVLATEYVNLSKKYLKEKNIDAVVLRTNGTTEVYPPDDADMIVDNSATGATLQANQLDVLDVLMESSTCLIANRDSLKRSEVAAKAKDLVMLLEATLAARKKVMIAMNVHESCLKPVLKALPAMKQPTIQPLAGGESYAVNTVVQRDQIRQLLPKLKALGATDIVEYDLRKVLP